MRSKVCTEITHPIPIVNGCTIEVLGMNKKYHPTLYNGCNYFYMLGLKLIHARKLDTRAAYIRIQITTAIYTIRTACIFAHFIHICSIASWQGQRNMTVIMIMSYQITFQIIYNGEKTAWQKLNWVELRGLIFYSKRIQITGISQPRLFDTN